MAISADAIVENGMLRPLQPLPLTENTRVRITIQADENWVDASYGICGWKGNAEELRQLALSPQFDLEDGQ